jgi:hypothetical protein
MPIENLLRIKDSVTHAVYDPAIIPDHGSYNIGVNVRQAVHPVYDSVSSLLTGSTAVVYYEMLASVTRIRKVVATGLTDGFFKLKLNGSVVAMGKITPLERVWVSDFGGVLIGEIGQSLTLEVTNTGVVTSGYEAIIYKGD